MPDSNLKAAVEMYFTQVSSTKESNAGTPEGSYYTSLNNLLNAVGTSLKPEVECIGIKCWPTGTTGCRTPRLRSVRQEPGIEKTA